MMQQLNEENDKINNFSLVNGMITLKRECILTKFM